MCEQLKHVSKLVMPINSKCLHIKEGTATDTFMSHHTMHIHCYSD